MSSDFLAAIAEVLGVCLTIVGSIWFFALWINKQLWSIKDLIYVKIEDLKRDLSDKLEYHERHDDERFGQLRNDIWDIRVRNAATDGLPPLVRGKNNGQ